MATKTITVTQDFTIDAGTSTKNFYAVMPIATINSGITERMSPDCKILSVKMHLTVSFTCKWDARVYVEAGLGDGSDIKKVILEEKQIATMDTSGTESYSRDISAYLVNDTPFNMTTSYGENFRVRFQSGNIFKKTFTINTLDFEITYEEPCTITFEASPSGAGGMAGGNPQICKHGSTATLTAVPYAGYKFLKWSDGVTTASRTVTVTGNATYTAVFIISRIFINTSQPLKIYIDTQEVKEVYIDTTKVYG